MVNGMMSIKEYAEARNKTTQAVYKQLESKLNKEALKGHIFTLKVNNKNTRFLDEEAVRVLDDASKQTPSVILQTDDKEKIEALEQENKVLLEKVAVQADKLAAQSEELYNTKMQIQTLERKKLEAELQFETEKTTAKEQIELHQEELAAQQKEIAELKAQLEAEQNRKLSFAERFRGRKKHRD